MNILRVISRTTTSALCVLSLLGLAACGGGGGGDGGGGAAVPVAASTTTGTDTTAAAPAAPATPDPAPVAASANSMPLTISTGTNASGVNLPLVSVQLCAPGTGTCQTVDNVLIDTGSVGVRIAAAALSTAMLAALPQESVDSVPLAACQQFLETYTWGTMRVADVTLGPKSAAALPLQIVGDTAAGDAPASCVGDEGLVEQSSPAQLGTNGIIGMAALLHDCGAACAQEAIPATYYTCAAGAECQGAIVPLAMQAPNLVAQFAQDNNGVVLSLPAIGAQGQGTTVGTLYFGVSTQANNTLSGATVLETDPQTLHISATYNGASFPDSFIDSGSNFLYLNDSTITRCAAGSFELFYCPADPLSLTASLATIDGSWLDAAFSIVDAQSLFASNPGVVAVNNVALTNATGIIDFGLPFFYGKRIAVLNQGGTALGQDGPFTALAPY